MPLPTEPGRGVILLVEDNPGDAALTLRALQRNGIPNEVVVAEDGVEALDYLFGTGKHAGRESVVTEMVLLDLKMPRVDGIEVVRRLRADARTRHLPVIMLTSSREDRDVLACYEVGCNSYVRKPVDFTEFAEAIRQLGQYWLALNIAAPAARAGEAA